MQDVNLSSLLLLEIADATWSASLGQLLELFKPAGLFFRKLTSPEATFEACRESVETCRESARALGTLPILAIEEEGGGALTALLPPQPDESHPQALARALSLDASGAAEAGAAIGRAMRLLGLNFNRAPTLDIEPTPTIGSGVMFKNGLDPRHSERSEESRSARKGHTRFLASLGMTAIKAVQHPLGNELSSNAGGKQISPAETAQRAVTFVESLGSERVLCCGRHFPGLPSSKATPPATRAIIIDRSLAALWREELVPYRALGNKPAAIEISYAVHRAYDYEFLRPASLSAGVIEGLLRAKLGYRGVALADASAAAEAAGIEVEEAVVRALAAGCDLVLVPGERKLLEHVCQSLGRAAEAGRLPDARISEALGRVRTVQKSLRRPARQLAAAQYSRLERDFEAFARKWSS